MGGTTVRAVSLFFQEGTSDKVYNATIVEDGSGTYSVDVEWGRRGSKLNRGRKAIKVSLAVAEKTYARLVREKTSKGYEELTDAVQPQEQAPPEGEGSGSRATGVRKKVGHVAQLLNAIEQDDAFEHMEDDLMMVQQKLDGNRVLLHVEDAEVVPTNRAGQRTTVHAAILEAARAFPLGTVVDGEVVPGEGGPTYWLFDILFWGPEDVRTEGYGARWERLSASIAPLLSGPMAILACARTTDEKWSLYERLREARAEGIVFKDIRAPYTPGRPSSGGTQLKHKFVKSADVLLTENAGNAYQMAVYRGPRLCHVGKVFSGTSNTIREEIDEALARGERPIAEVRYLYATDDDQLFQPVFVRLRDDKEDSECVLEQLEKTNRVVQGV